MTRRLAISGLTSNRVSRPLVALRADDGRSLLVVLVIAIAFFVLPVPSLAQAGSPGEVALGYFFVLCRSRCTAYDYLSIDEQTNTVVAIGESGQPETLPLHLPFSYTGYISIPWDFGTNQPASPTRTIKPQFLFHYVRAIGTLVARPIGACVAALVLLALQILSAIWRNKYVGLWWAVPVMLCALGFCGEVGMLSQEIDFRSTVLRLRLLNHRAADGHVLPTSPDELVAELQNVNDLKVMALITALMHIPLIVLLVRAHHGLHYLLVSHPVERRFRKGVASVQEVDAAMGQGVDVEHPPPEYKSRNWRRRIEELRKRIDAETDFIESDIVRRRARAKWHDDSPQHTHRGVDKEGS